MNRQTMKTLKDLFEHQLKDLYSAENQMVDALPKMVDKASNTGLKTAFESHLAETKEQRNRIQDICRSLEIEPSGEKCKAMEGLIREVESFLEEEIADEVRDAGLIANAQRIEHYEISGYGTAVRYAKQLGHSEIADKLQQTLDQEYEADQKLNNMAEQNINQKAMS